MNLQKKGKKVGGVEDLSRAADQFWSDVSRKRKSLQSPSFTRDIHTHPTHNTQSPILHSQSSVRTKNPRFLTGSPTSISHSSIPDNNSRNFQHQSLDHGTKHSSRTLNTSHSPASTLASKTQPSRYSVNININKRPLAPASLPGPSLVTVDPTATLPSVQENEPSQTKLIDYIVSMFR